MFQTNTDLISMTGLDLKKKNKKKHEDSYPVELEHSKDFKIRSSISLLSDLGIPFELITFPDGRTN